MKTLGQPRSAHRYRLTVEPRVELSDDDGLDLVETITEVEVKARTRWCAIDAAEQAGYTVTQCELIRD